MAVTHLEVYVEPWSNVDAVIERLTADLPSVQGTANGLSDQQYHEVRFTGDEADLHELIRRV